jgi:uncharacterized protein (TIGR02001 family)
MRRRLAAAFALLAAAPATAQALPAFDLTGEVGLLSDYRFRGLSLSDGDPALRGVLTLSHASGLYTGVRATTLRTGAGRDLGDGEFDLYAGWRGDLGRGFDLDAGITYYAFAGAAGHADQIEPYASIGYLIGPAQFAAGAKYAPSQRGTLDEDRLYLFGQARIDLPGRPIAFTAEAGRQDRGRLGAYWTWSLGGRYRIGVGRRAAIEFGLDYVDTDLPSARGQDAALLASAALRF